MHWAKTFLLLTIVIFSLWVPSLNPCTYKSPIKRVQSHIITSTYTKWSGSASEAVFTVNPSLGSFKIRQAIVVSPTQSTQLHPFFKVIPVTTNINHSINR
jgi:hypothetical protein